MDELGRPRVLLIGPGNSHDITVAHALIDKAGSFETLLADRGYDADHLRKRLADGGVKAVIPARSRRRNPSSHDPAAYRQRNVIERLWARLKDYRRVATRYDKLAANFLSGVLIAALVIYWAK